MKSLISQVYELTNLAILTPQNLVENIQLDNYLEIKYYKREDEIVCEMLTEDDNEKIIYFIILVKIINCRELLQCMAMKILNYLTGIRN